MSQWKCFTWCIKPDISFSFSYDFASLCHSYIFGYAHGGRVAKICNIPDIYNCSMISLLVGFEIPLNERQKSILICISIGLIGMNIVVFYLINSILKREMELRENKIFLERVKNETEMYRSISENYDKQRKREHEYQNHMQVISDLLKNKKYQELERFIDESNSDTAGKIDKIDTNHVIVNSILNTKYREAREKKIVFVVKEMIFLH